MASSSLPSRPVHQHRRVGGRCGRGLRRHPDRHDGRGHRPVHVHHGHAGPCAGCRGGQARRGDRRGDPDRCGRSDLVRAPFRVVVELHRERAAARVSWAREVDGVERSAMSLFATSPTG
jgi:hypothetical protein